MFNMTWEEAKQAMREGKSVHHRHFCDEWFQMINGRIVDEAGYFMDRWYKGEDWQNTGWAICE